MKLCVYIYNYNVYTHTDAYGTHVQAVYVCADTQISEEDSKVRSITLHLAPFRQVLLLKLECK